MNTAQLPCDQINVRIFNLMRQRTSWRHDINTTATTLRYWRLTVHRDCAQRRPVGATKTPKCMFQSNSCVGFLSKSKLIINGWVWKTCWSLVDHYFGAVGLQPRQAKVLACAISPLWRCLLKLTRPHSRRTKTGCSRIPACRHQRCPSSFTYADPAVSTAFETSEIGWKHRFKTGFLTKR